MIIDIHCHLMHEERLLQARAQRSWAQMFAEFDAKRGKKTTTDEIIATSFTDMVDPNGDKVIGIMDAAGIDKTVVLGAVTDFDLHNAAPAYEDHNKAMGTICKKHPGRLIYFVAVHPPVKDALKTMETNIKKWNAGGVKFDPIGGEYDADDKANYPLYEYVQAANLPIVMHCGPRPEDPNLKGSHPEKIGKVLADFPKLTIVAAHMGFAWWRELIEVAKVRPNLYCDISANQLSAAVSYGRFCYMLRKVVDGFGADRVCLGTDAPYFDYFFSRPEWVKLIRELPEKAPAETKFTEKEVTGILGENAKRILVKSIK